MDLERLLKTRKNDVQWKEQVNFYSKLWRGSQPGEALVKLLQRIV
jgi:hypothetical protein